MEGKALLRYAARGLSLILHPIFIPIAVLLYQYPLDGGFTNLHLSALICLIILPGGVTLLWLQIREEQDLFVVDRGNRILPLGAVLLGTVFFAFANAILLPDPLFQAGLIVHLFVLSFLALILTFYYKISLHAIGWSALLVNVVFNGAAPVWWLSIVGLTLLAGWARFQLRSHDLGQLLAGLFLGGSIALLLVEFAL